MRGRHPEALDGFPLEIELDQHGRRAADHGRIVARIDRHDLRRLVVG
jgi:hypothetical protein